MHHSPQFVLRSRRRTPGQRMVMVIIAKKVAPRAVDRNRIRRQVAEAFRRVVGSVPLGTQTVITVHHLIMPRSSELERVIFELLRQSGMLSR